MGAFCTNCGTPLPEGAGFCPKCGTKVEALCCPSCGKELDFGVDFCIYCGQRLKEESPVPEPEQEESTPATEPLSQPEPPTEEKETDTPKENAPLDSELPEEKSPPDAEGQRVFTWSHEKPQGRVGSAVTTVNLWLEQEMLHIQKEFSDTVTSHKNTLPEETIPLSEIENVYIQKKGLSVSVILLFLCVALVLYGGVSGKFDFGTTALCLLGLAVIIALRYRGQMKRYQLVIIEKNTKRTVLKGDDPQTIDEAAMAILDRLRSVSGASPETRFTSPAPPPKKKRSGLKIAGIILGAIVLVIGGIEAYQVLYVRNGFPSSVMENPDVKDYVSTQINGELYYLFTVDVTGGRLVKNTALPQKEDGLLTYLFVDYIYDITVTADDGESATGQVTVNCSFSTRSFESRPKDIVFNSFTYSDEISQFIEEEWAKSLKGEDLVGCWKFKFAEWVGGETVSGDGQEEYFCIYSDNFCQYVNGYSKEVLTQGTWGIWGETATVQWVDEEEPRTVWIEDDSLILQTSEKTSQFERVSPLPDAVWDIIAANGDSGGGTDLYFETDYYTIDIPDDWGELSNCYSWKNKESLDGCQYRVSFYEKGSEEDGYGGYVFSIELWRDESYLEGENYELLGSLADVSMMEYGRPSTLVGYIVITYPTDVQYSEAHAETYMKMYHEIDDILASFTAKDGYNLFTE